MEIITGALVPPLFFDMTFIRNFLRLSIPPRMDGVRFVRAELYESALSDGPWVLIDSFDFEAGPGVSPTGLDSDPMRPMRRSFTTSSALIDPDAFYRFIWIDENDAQANGAPIEIASVSLSTIEQLVRFEMPLSFDSLANDTGNGAIGIAGLRTRINQVRYSILPEIYANMPDESYRKIVQSFISKSAALDLIPIAIEYWMRQAIAKTATGTSEVVSYTDTTAALRELARRLQVQIAQLENHPEVAGLMTPAQDAPGVSGADEGPLTADPYLFPPAFAEGIPNSEVRARNI